MDVSNSSNIRTWLEESIREIERLPDQKEYAFLSICCALWVIWKTRNSCIFEGKIPDPRGVMIQVRGLISDYASLIPPPQRNERDRNARIFSWRPPHQQLLN